MKLYSVFLPTGGATAHTLERARFVKLGFSWPAFLATPLWAARHGLWLAFGLWMALLIVIGLLVGFAHVGPAAAFLLYNLGALAFGLEADRFRQRRLSRAGFLIHGLTLGDSVGDAETVYFAQRADNLFPAKPQPAQSRDDGGKPPTAGATDGADLLGLFPSRESHS
jgi:hypothetical protein